MGGRENAMCMCGCAEGVGTASVHDRVDVKCKCTHALIQQCALPKQNTRHDVNYIRHGLGGTCGNIKVF